jgi:hypothetical protein
VITDHLLSIWLNLVHELALLDSTTSNPRLSKVLISSVLVSLTLRSGALILIIMTKVPVLEVFIILKTVVGRDTVTASYKDS